MNKIWITFETSLFLLVLNQVAIRGSPPNWCLVSHGLSKERLALRILAFAVDVLPESIKKEYWDDLAEVGRWENWN